MAKKPAKEQVGATTVKVDLNLKHALKEVGVAFETAYTELCAYTIRRSSLLDDFSDGGSYTVKTGGDKNAQAKDIALALKLAKEV